MTADKINVLLIGGGGREHALAWKLAQSPRLAELHCAPGNPGIGEVAQCVDLDVSDHGAVIEFCRALSIGFVVVGPEAPLVAGLVDDLEAAGIAAFGPSAAAAQLEGSKGFTKDLCARFSIPTAAYERFNNAPKAKRYVRERGAPIVVKADGLAAGKGVVVAQSLDEALDAVDACFEGEFGEAGSEVIVEEWLEGTEASVFALCDGQTALLMGTAQDHKRVGDGDTGPNTGGMGAFSPAGNLDQTTIDEVMTTIIVPTLAAMAARGTPFIGVLYAGLMMTAGGPKLIEYNVRFGDPECQVLMMRLQSDLLELLLAASEGRLLEVEADWSDDAALTVVMATRGYPGAYDKGSAIGGRLEPGDSGRVFHAGTAMKDGQLVANGGRVLAVTAIGGTLGEARENAYARVDAIDWPEGFCRGDIGATQGESA